MSLYVLYHGELYHYGVKGMKWGIRRTPEQLGHKKVLKKSSKRDIEKKKLMQELASRNEKFKPEAIHGITRMKDGRIAWLETGNDRAGMSHILKRHAKDFANAGVPKATIPNYLMTALSTGTKVGRQGRTRHIYEFSYKGEKRRVAIELGSNGFIVSANSKGIAKTK